MAIRTEFVKPERGRYLHRTEHPEITHYRATVLQGFSATHRLEGVKAAISGRIGNAVRIPLAASIGQRPASAS